MLAAAALGALGAQLEQLQAAKQDWFVGASLVDEQDISLEADGAVTVRRQAFDKALRNFPKTDSPSKAKAARKMEVTDYDQVIAGERFCSRSERQALASAAATTWWSSTSVSRVRRVTDGCCACRDAGCCRLRPADWLLAPVGQERRRLRDDRPIPWNEECY